MADTTLPGVLLKGVAASRPAANAVAKGSVYSATDTGAITQSDGVSTWSTYATIASPGAVATDAIWDAAGDLAVGTGANTAAKLAIGADSTVLTISASTHLPVWQAPAAGGFAHAYATVATDQASKTSPFGDLATAGPSVTLTVNTKVKVTISADGYDSASGAAYGRLGVDISGANTVAASDTQSYVRGANTSGNSTAASRVLYYSGLTPGSTTFKVQYYASSTNWHERRREILVECLD